MAVSKRTSKSTYFSKCHQHSFLFFAIILIATAAKRVESGHVGIIRKYGKVYVDQPLEEGLHWVAPLVISVEEMSVRVHAASLTSHASSKDLQIITTDITCQYYVENSFVPRVFQKMGTLSNVEVTIIQPAIQESMKSVVAQYTAEELITRRETVKTKIHDEIAEFIKITLQAKDIVGAIKIANVAITDFQFSEEFNRAIEMKVKAEQEALQAQMVKNRTITEAEALFEQQKLAANGQAYQTIKEAEARADAIKLEGASLVNNSQLIQLRIAEKWDGSVSKIRGDSGNLLLDVNSLTSN